MDHALCPFAAERGNGFQFLRRLADHGGLVIEVLHFVGNTVQDLALVIDGDAFDFEVEREGVARHIVLIAAGRPEDAVRRADVVQLQVAALVGCQTQGR